MPVATAGGQEAAGSWRPAEHPNTPCTALPPPTAILRPAGWDHWVGTKTTGVPGSLALDSLT